MPLPLLPPQRVLQGPEVGFHGAASGNASVNPDFYNWNLAVIKYCDGGSFGASMGQAQPPKGETKALFFLGHWNLQGSLADLVLRQGLAEGKAALVGGCSAGGQTVSMACDAIAKYLRAYGVPTKCFMDAGYFPGTPLCIPLARSCGMPLAHPCSTSQAHPLCIPLVH